jgi:hypothetical protein
VKKLEEGTAVNNNSSAEQISMDEEIARQMMQEEQAAQASSTPPALRRVAAPAIPQNSGKKKGRGTPTQLPANFLKIPGQVDEDEALARMLQNEMFAKEVKKNPEFAHLAARNRAATARSTGTTAPNPGPGIMDAISEMGEAAKSRLAMLANRFNQNKNRAPQATGGSGGSSGAAERRGLLDNDNNVVEEEVSFFSRPSVNNNYEMSDWGNNKSKSN